MSVDNSPSTTEVNTSPVAPEKKGGKERDSREQVMEAVNKGFSFWEKDYQIPGKLTDEDREKFAEFKSDFEQTISHKKPRGVKVNKIPSPVSPGEFITFREGLRVNDLAKYLEDKLKEEADNPQADLDSVNSLSEAANIINRNSRMFVSLPSRSKPEHFVARVNQEAQRISEKKGEVQVSPASYAEAHAHINSYQELLVPQAKAKTPQLPPALPSPALPVVAPDATGGSQDAPDADSPDSDPDESDEPESSSHQPQTIQERRYNILIANNTEHVSTISQMLAREAVNGEWRVNSFSESKLKWLKSLPRKAWLRWTEPAVVNRYKDSIMKVLISNNASLLNTPGLRGVAAEVTRQRDILQAERGQTVERLKAADSQDVTGTRTNAQGQTEIAGRGEKRIQLQQDDTLRQALLHDVLNPLIRGDVTGQDQVREKLNQFIENNRGDSRIQEMFTESANKFADIGEWADDLMEQAGQIRTDKEAAGKTLEEMDQYIDLQLGLARSQVNSEHFTIVDKAIVWTKRKRAARLEKGARLLAYHRIVDNPLVVGVATALAVRTFYMPARAMGTAAHLTPLGVGTAVAALVAAGRERSQTLDDIAQHRTQRAYNEQIRDPRKDKRRQEIEKLETGRKKQSEVIDAKELLTGSSDDTQASRDAITTQTRKSAQALKNLDVTNGTQADLNRREVLSRVAEIRAREEFGVTNHRDYIRFEARAKAAGNLLELTKLKVELRQHLRDAGMDNEEIIREENAMVGKWKIRLMTDKKDVDKEIKWYVGKRMLKGASMAAVTGLVGGLASQEVAANVKRGIDHLAGSGRETGPTALEKSINSLLEKSGRTERLPGAPDALPDFKSLYATGGDINLPNQMRVHIDQNSHLATLFDLKTNQQIALPDVTVQPNGHLIMNGDPTALKNIPNAQEIFRNWQITGTTSPLQEQLLAVQGAGKDTLVNINGQDVPYVNGKLWPAPGVSGVIDATGKVRFEGNDQAMTRFHESIKQMGFGTSDINYIEHPSIHNRMTEAIKELQQPGNSALEKDILTDDGAMSIKVTKDGKVFISDLIHPGPATEGTYYADFEATRSGTTFAGNPLSARGELYNIRVEKSLNPETLQRLREEGFTFAEGSAPSPASPSLPRIETAIAPPDVRGHATFEASLPQMTKLIPPLPPVVDEIPIVPTAWAPRRPLEELRKKGYYSESFSSSQTLADLIRRGRVAPRRAGNSNSPGALTEFSTLSRTEGEGSLRIIHDRFEESPHIYIALAGAIGDAAITSAYLDGIRQYAENTPVPKKITIIAPDLIVEMLKPTAEKYGYDMVSANRYECVDKARELISTADEHNAMVFDFDFTTENGPNPILEEGENDNVFIHELFATGVGLYKNDRAGKRRYGEFLGDLLHVPPAERLNIQPSLMLPGNASQIYEEMKNVHNIDDTKRQISLVVEGSGAFKRYDLAKWKEALQTIADDTKEINIIYHASYTEDELKAVFGDLPNVRYIKPSIQQSLVFLQQQDLVIANDTGLSHIAAIVESGPQVISVHGLDLTPNTWVTNTSRHIGIWSGSNDRDVNTIPPNLINEEVKRQLIRLETTKPKARLSIPHEHTPSSPGGSVSSSAPLTTAVPSSTTTPITPITAHEAASVLPPAGERTGTDKLPHMENMESTARIETSDNIAGSLGDLEEFSRRDRLESKEAYEKSLDEVMKVLEGQSGIAEVKDLPTLIIPDLHARRDFLYMAMASKVKEGQYSGQTMFDLLKQGKINVVCLGDGMHSEVEENWSVSKAKGGHDLIIRLLAAQKSAKGKIQGENPQLSPAEINQLVEDDSTVKGIQKELAAISDDLVTKEMVRSFGLMKMIMDLKISHPENFHYIRGNHDDIAERIRHYYKYASESDQVKTWVEKHYGEEFLNKWAEFEASLPLVVRGKSFIASHTVPNKPITEDEIRLRNKETTDSLTWTDNTKWETNEATIKTVLGNLGVPNEIKWIIGHRWVHEHEGKYREQFGNVIQINNPNEYVIAFVPPSSEPFVPARQVYKI